MLLIRTGYILSSHNGGIENVSLADVFGGGALCG